MDASSERGLYSAGVAELERMAAYLRDQSMPLHGSPAEPPGASAIGLRCASVAGAEAASDQATIEARCPTSARSSFGDHLDTGVRR